MKQEKYNCVSCDFIDRVEIAATYKKRVHLSVTSETNESQIIKIENVRIKTWQTENKIEYMILEYGMKIRMDKILSMEETY